jgi:hypothetical protein
MKSTAVIVNGTLRRQVDPSKACPWCNNPYQEDTIGLKQPFQRSKTSGSRSVFSETMLEMNQMSDKDRESNDHKKREVQRENKI